MEKTLGYKEKAEQYADGRGIIFYEIEDNIMRYEEQVKSGLSTYELYNAEIDLDTGIVTQVQVK